MKNLDWIPRPNVLGHDHPSMVYWVALKHKKNWQPKNGIAVVIPRIPQDSLYDRLNTAHQEYLTRNIDALDFPEEPK